MADVTKMAARLAAKPEDEYRVDEFKNVDGGYSAALVDNKTGSITLQANSGSAGDARKKLEDAVAQGNVLYLDPGVPPEVPQTDYKGMTPGDEREAAARENERSYAEAQRVTDGYNVLSTGGEYATPKAVDTPAAVAETADKAPKKATGTTPKAEYSADSNDSGKR